MERLEIQSEKELIEKSDVLGITDKEQKKETTCSLTGHSKIQTFCFGYYNYARCFCCVHYVTGLDSAFGMGCRKMVDNTMMPLQTVA